MNRAMTRSLLATEKVRYVGEPIAVIVTETRYQGEDVAELVEVDYEPLPVVVDVDQAAQDEVLLFEDVGTNVALDFNFGADESLFDGCDVVVRERILNQRVAPCPMEVRSAAAIWEGDHLTYYISNQAPHTRRADLASLYGLDNEMIRVITPDVGGGFGAKGGTYPEELLLPWISRAVGCPVRWIESRSESMISLSHGRAQVQYVEIGGTRDGKVLAFRSTALQDAGAYPQLGAFLVVITRTMAPGVYALPRFEMNVKSVLTNTTPIAAYRGAGRPEATYAIERAMDLFAGEIGMDPVAVRRLNVIPDDAFPFETLGGQTYDIGNYARALDLVVEAADYETLRRDQQTRRAQLDVKQLGIGVCTYVEVTNAVPGSEFGSVEVVPGGKVRVRAGTLSHGQGHWTTFSMIVSDQLGIGLNDIEFIQGDTDEVPFGLGTMGSRSAQTAGAAVLAASIEVEMAGREAAAGLFEAAVEDIVFDREAGRFHIAGVPSVSKTWADVAGSDDGTGIRRDVDFSPNGRTFPFGAHVAVVEVDMETGQVQLLRHVAVDDAGRILNPLIFEGQVHGGLAQGIAQALLEEMSYDTDGNPLTSTLADYAMISAAELPSFDLVRMETPTPLNDLGAKGVGESGTIGSTPAVVNAVCDALSVRGIRHLDMPLTPQKVWAALQASHS